MARYAASFIIEVQLPQIVGLFIQGDEVLRLTITVGVQYASHVAFEVDGGEPFHVNLIASVAIQVQVVLASSVFGILTQIYGNSKRRRGRATDGECGA